MAKKLNSNEDLVRDLMNYSPRGALCQAFIMTAIEKYCEQVIAVGEDHFVGGLINGKAWLDVAVDTKQRIDAFYGRHAE